MRIAVVGGYGVATTFRVPALPTAGATVLAVARFIGPGGKGSNQAIGAARLGASVALLTAVGTDQDGEDAFGLWAAEGIHADHVLRSASGTMAGTIAVDDRGENQILIHQGALLDLTAEHVVRFADEIARADVLLVSLETSVEVAAAALRIAREAGTTSVLNPAPAAGAPIELLAMADLVTPNQTEASDLLGQACGGTPEQAADGLLLAGSGGVVMTLGAHGALIADHDGRRMRVPAAAVEAVVDTTGAGDAFNAALAVGVGGGVGIERAVRFACRASAFVVQHDGVVAALPSAANVGRPEDQR